MFPTSKTVKGALVHISVVSLTTIPVTALARRRQRLPSAYSARPSSSSSGPIITSRTRTTANMYACRKIKRLKEKKLMLDGEALIHGTTEFYTCTFFPALLYDLAGTKPPTPKPQPILGMNI